MPLTTSTQWPKCARLAHRPWRGVGRATVTPLVLCACRGTIWRQAKPVQLAIQWWWGVGLATAPLTALLLCLATTCHLGCAPRAIVQCRGAWSAIPQQCAWSAITSTTWTLATTDALCVRPWATAWSATMPATAPNAKQATTPTLQSPTLQHAPGVGLTVWTANPSLLAINVSSATIPLGGPAKPVLLTVWLVIIPTIAWIVPPIHSTPGAPVSPALLPASAASQLPPLACPVNPATTSMALLPVPSAPLAVSLALVLPCAPPACRATTMLQQTPPALNAAPPTLTARPATAPTAQSASPATTTTALLTYANHVLPRCMAVFYAHPHQLACSVLLATICLLSLAITPASPAQLAAAPARPTPTVLHACLATTSTPAHGPALDVHPSAPPAPVVLSVCPAWSATTCRMWPQGPASLVMPLRRIVCPASMIPPTLSSALSVGLDSISILVLVLGVPATAWLAVRLLLV